MKLLTYILLIIIGLSLCNYTKAQITIDGTITDSEQNAISNVLVEITDEQYLANIYSATTDNDGYFIIAGITDVEGNNASIPKNYIVLRNYPNPFNPSTIIYYELPNSENIEIKIYDILGREVRTLFNNLHKAGVYHINWDGRNNFGASVSAGIYLCRLKTKDNFKVHKMVLLDGGSTSSALSDNKLKKNGLNSISKINGVFNFTLRVSGINVANYEFQNNVCSKDTTINLVVPTIIESISIGPEGGVFNNENFSIILPEGAFNDVLKLEFSVDPNDSSFLDNSASPIYLIDGIPDNISKDILFGIRLDNQTSDTLFSSICKSGGEGYYFNIEPTFDSLDYKYCKITPYYDTVANAQQLNKEWNLPLRSVMELIKNYSSLDTGLFYYYYPKKFSNEFSLFISCLSLSINFF